MGKLTQDQTPQEKLDLTNNTENAVKFYFGGHSCVKNKEGAKKSRLSKRQKIVSGILLAFVGAVIYWNLGLCYMHYLNYALIYPSSTTAKFILPAHPSFSFSPFSEKALSVNEAMRDYYSKERPPEIFLTLCWPVSCAFLWVLAGGTWILWLLTWILWLFKFLFTGSALKAIGLIP